jgi:hypothetical protein
MGSSISFLSPRGILFTSSSGDFNNSNTNTIPNAGYSQIIPNSHNETVNTQAQLSIVGNTNPNRHDTSNYFSEGPSILSPVKGSAFKATAVGLGLDKKLNEFGIFGMNNRVSFSGADLDEGSILFFIFKLFFLFSNQFFFICNSQTIFYSFIQSLWFAADFHFQVLTSVVSTTTKTLI